MKSKARDGDELLEQVFGGSFAVVAEPGDDWGHAECDRTLICEVQAALAARADRNNNENDDAALRPRVAALAQRLSKLQALGGPFSEVRLAPELEMMLLGDEDENAAAPRRREVLVH